MIGAPAREIHCSNPECQEWFRVPPKLYGHRVRCPHCRAETRAAGAIQVETLPAARRNCTLRIVSGPAFLNRDFELETQRAYSIGRTDDCEVQLPGHRVSRRHASLHWVNGHWVIEDLNSSHGTEINHRRITRHELGDGDLICLGEYELRFGVPRKGLRPAAELQDALPIADAQPEMNLSVPASVGHVDQSEIERILRAAGASFENRRDVKEAYQQAERDVRIRQVVWALGAIAGTLIVLWSIDVFKPARKAATTPVAASRPTPLAAIPPAFSAKLRDHRFSEARQAIELAEKEGPAGAELSRRMKGLLDAEAARWNSSLLESARSAANQEKWDAVRETLASIADPSMERFAPQWADLRQRCESDQLRRTLKNLRKTADYENAFAFIAGDEARVAADPALFETAAAIRSECGAGLRVVTHPAAQSAEIELDGRPLGPASTTHWKLRSGSFDLLVRAKGYRDAVATVDLESGTLTTSELRLRPAADGPLWVLNAIRNAGRPAAHWAAASYYSRSAASGVRLSRGDLASMKHAAWKGSEAARPRIAKVTLGDKTTLIAQVWSQPGFVSIRELPRGDKRTLKEAEVTEIADVPAERSARLLAENLMADLHENGAANVLNGLGSLLLQFGEVDQAETALYGPIRQCLEVLEKACAGCCGAGLAECPDCGGRGKIVGEVECPRCKGTRRMPCAFCGGKGNVRCGVCEGTGETAVKVRKGLFSSDSFRPCTVCHGKGRQACPDCRAMPGNVECRRCAATGRLKGKGECPTCKGEKRILCAGCRGEKLRSEMDSAAREAAEDEALSLGKSEKPAP